jgi:hypothetical protein
VGDEDPDAEDASDPSKDWLGHRPSRQTNDEDMKRSDNLRRGIIERAPLDQEFDILAAWEELEKLDESINERIVATRRNKWSAVAECGRKPARSKVYAEPRANLTI